MRTTLDITLTQTCNIPGLSAHAHDLPGYPGIICIDFINKGNKELPANLQSIMLVPEDQEAPHLGKDRTLYTVPGDYSEVIVDITLGEVNGSEFIAANVTVRNPAGESFSHPHVPCELP